MEGGGAGGPAALSSILPGANHHHVGSAGGATAPGGDSLFLRATVELAAQEGRVGNAPTVSDVQQGVFAALRWL